MNGWIPVSKGLPANNTTVLLTVFDSERTIGEETYPSELKTFVGHIDRFDNEHYWTYEDEDGDTGCIEGNRIDEWDGLRHLGYTEIRAWMPLPDPYDEGVI